MPDLEAIIAEVLAAHAVVGTTETGAREFVVCTCGHEEEQHAAHQAEQIAARLGIEPIGAWGTTSRLAPVRADGTTEQFELYRVRALESQ